MQEAYLWYWATRARLDARDLNQTVHLQSIVLADANATVDGQRRAKELELELQTIRSELSELYKVQSQNAQKLVDTMETIKVREQALQQQQEEMQKLTSKLSTITMQWKDTLELIKEKDGVIQILKDELATHQLELVQREEQLKQAQERVGTLEKENSDLIDRWMKLKQEEAQKINEVNEFVESALKTKQVVVTQSSSKSAKLAESGSTVVSGHLDNSLRVWDIRSGTCVRELPGLHSNQITSVVVSFVDRDLAHKLREELKFEQSNAEKEEPTFVHEFKQKNIFKIEDRVGEKEINLVRNFGNENTDALSEQYEFEDEEMDEERAFPVNVTILIEKKAGSEDAGAMEITAVAQDKSFLIESVSFCSSSPLINDQTAEGDWQRRGRYGGPVFTDLDDDLQELFHTFLKERGFDEGLAEFIPLYIEWKEQNEYTAWLSKVAESHEVGLGGFGNGEFQAYTPDPRTSYVKNGILHIKPILTTEFLGISRPDIYNGYTLNLTERYNCTGGDNVCARTSNTTAINFDSIITPVMSAKLRLKAPFATRYGKGEIRFKVPQGKWLWPAIWLMPQDSEYGVWPRSGELDVMESRGNSPSYRPGGNDKMISNVQWGADFSLRKSIAKQMKRRHGTLATSFHTVGWEWTPDYFLTWLDSPLRTNLYVPFNENPKTKMGGYPTRFANDTPVTVPDWNVNSAPFDKAFYLILNVAVGGTNGFFPDNEDGKPWQNTDSPGRAMYKFFEDSSNWYDTTWPEGDDRAFQIDHSKTFSLSPGERAIYTNRIQHVIDFCQVMVAVAARTGPTATSSTESDANLTHPGQNVSSSAPKNSYILDRVYLAGMDYKAQSEMDINIRRGDRVKIVTVMDDETLGLGSNLETGTSGTFPILCVTSGTITSENTEAELIAQQERHAETEAGLSSGSVTNAVPGQLSLDADAQYNLPNGNREWSPLPVPNPLNRKIGRHVAARSYQSGSVLEASLELGDEVEIMFWEDDEVAVGIHIPTQSEGLFRGSMLVYAGEASASAVLAAVGQGDPSQLTPGGRLPLIPGATISAQPFNDSQGSLYRPSVENAAIPDPGGASESSERKNILAAVVAFQQTDANETIWIRSITPSWPRSGPCHHIGKPGQMVQSGQIQ
ncbi:hypothetical protein HDU96_004112 [Phlyctochytrium bullatum]|nr:hypothetical protein HDU96_004112 [Phlyctochytrium bullatum]